MSFNLVNIFSKRTQDVAVGGVRRPLFFGGAGSTPVTTDSAMQVAAFYRGVTFLSTQIAKLPWYVKDKSQEEIDDDISVLLDLAPNRDMNAFMFRVLAVSQALIEGNFYAEIERTYSGRPVAIWPLASRKVDVLRSVGGEIIYRVNEEDGPVYLPARDVFHLKNFHTKDGIIGQGVVAYGVANLGMSLAATNMASGIFNNGGMPSGVITYDGTLSEEASRRLKESWDLLNAGRKTGGTRVLENGMQYTPVLVQPDVLQFLESRQFSVLEIARYLGVPPTKLYDTTAATYSNVENANLEVATDTLDAWAVNLEQEADVKILNYRYGGKFTEVDLREVFRGDSKARSGYYKDMMSVAAITPNQIRKKEGMAGYGPDGDKYFVATNNYSPIDRMDEIIDATIAGKSKAGKDASAPAPDPQQKELTQAAISFLKK